MSILRSTTVGILTDTPPVLSKQKKPMTEHLLQEIDFYSYNNESALLFQEERAENCRYSFDEKQQMGIYFDGSCRGQMTNWD